MNNGKRQCEATAANGKRCNASALVGSKYCFFHDPDHAAERQEAQALGGRQGRMKTLPEERPDIQVETSHDIVEVLAETMNDVLKGRIDPKVANTVGYLSNIILKAIEQSAIDERLTELEEIVKKRPIDELERVY